jgi:hypothetical protein
MPRFYFHLKSKEACIPDDSGKDFDTLNDAYKHGVTLIDKILLRTGRLLPHQGPGRHRVRTLSAAMRVFVPQTLISRSSSGARRARVRSALSDYLPLPVSNAFLAAGTRSTREVAVILNRVPAPP